jgi:alkylated DNA repair protein (DNA oxidative demethylase)
MPPEVRGTSGDWTLDLFEPPPARRALDPGALLLGGFALERAPQLLAALHEVITVAPLRHLVTPGGYRMSVAMSNCGRAGWVSDARGYRYDAIDPDSGKPWPAMPQVFAALAADAAQAAGYAGFTPDACLINRYEPGSRLSLHQDRDEPDRSQPIVSVSLGLPAIFLWGGQARGDRPRRVPLVHGDVVVWGGPARLTYHGVHTLAGGQHPLTGTLRYNLTFRKAL